MAQRSIRLFGDPVLRTACDAVGRFDESLISLVADLEETVSEPGRAGLAANQIGVSRRAFAYNVDRLGQPVVIEGEGLLARCIQHEVDHLNGRLFVDRLSGTVRKHAMRDLRERYAS